MIPSFLSLMYLFLIMRWPRRFFWLEVVMSTQSIAEWNADVLIKRQLRLATKDRDLEF